MCWCVGMCNVVVSGMYWYLLVSRLLEAFFHRFSSSVKLMVHLGGHQLGVHTNTVTPEVLAEYVWLDADGVTRSKTMTMTARSGA